MNIKEEKELSCLNKNKMSNTLNQYRTLNKKNRYKISIYCISDTYK